MIRHLVMKYLAQVPLVYCLAALLARIEVLRLADGLTTDPILNDLARLDLPANNRACALDTRNRASEIW